MIIDGVVRKKRRIVRTRLMKTALVHHHKGSTERFSLKKG
jgi:hypothetical protein